MSFKFLYGIIAVIAFDISTQKGMIFCKYKIWLMTRLKNWRSVYKSYGEDWLIWRTGAAYPILKPLGLCLVCTSFWIGLIFTQSFILSLLTMVLTWVYVKKVK